MARSEKPNGPLAVPGAALERLIGTIENAIANNENYTVEISERLRDKDTGRLREHDVVLTYRHAHHTTVTAIECRDRSRKVGVPEIEQFQKKCERTGVHRGMIVSQIGFTDTALTKAEAMSIQCLSLEEAPRFPWCEASFTTVQSHPRIHSARFVPEPAPADMTGMTLYARPDVLIDKDRMLDVTRRLIIDWRATEHARPGRHRINFRVQGTEFYLEDEKGAQFVVEQLTVCTDFEYDETLSPVTFQRYQIPGGEAVAEIASSVVDLGGRKARLVFVNQAGGGTTVMLAIE